MLNGGLFVLLACIASTRGSHFRGAIITWKPIENTTIEISFRVSWTGSSDCNVYNASLVCFKCFNETDVPITKQTGYSCTDVSHFDQWASEEASFTYDYRDSAEEFFVGYQGTSWEYLVTISVARWSIISMVNTTRHDSPDAGVNFSPITLMQPVIRINGNCLNNVRIPVFDVDGNIIRCRWASKSKYPADECSDVCEAFPNATLNEEQCELNISAVSIPGFYAVAIQVEDFLSESRDTPLSSVPLQFLFWVTTNFNCSTNGPTFKWSTIADGERVHLQYGDNYTLQIIAETPNSHIQEITTASPRRMSKSSLTAGPGEWYVNVSWTPEFSQIGPHFFSFAAIDDLGLSTEQRCILFIVQGWR